MLETRKVCIISGEPFSKGLIGRLEKSGFEVVFWSEELKSYLAHYKPKLTNSLILNFADGNQFQDLIDFNQKLKIPLIQANVDLQLKTYKESNDCNCSYWIPTKKGEILIKNSFRILKTAKFFALILTKEDFQKSLPNHRLDFALFELEKKARYIRLEHSVNFRIELKHSYPEKPVKNMELDFISKISESFAENCSGYEKGIVLSLQEAFQYGLIF